MTKPTNLEELQQWKQKMIADLEYKLGEFTLLTGLVVDRIDIDFIDTSTMRQTHKSGSYNVKVEVEL
jgi:hypothetical protein